MDNTYENLARVIDPATWEDSTLSDHYRLGSLRAADRVVAFLTSDEAIDRAARRLWRDEHGQVTSHDSRRTRESDEVEMDRTGFGAWDHPTRIARVVKDGYRAKARAAILAALGAES